MPSHHRTETTFNKINLEISCRILNFVFKLQYMIETLKGTDIPAIKHIRFSGKIKRSRTNNFIVGYNGKTGYVVNRRRNGITELLHCPNRNLIIDFSASTFQEALLFLTDTFNLDEFKEIKIETI